MWSVFKIFQIFTILIFLRFLLKYGVEENVMKDLASRLEGLENDRTVTEPLHHVGIITTSLKNSSVMCGGTIISKNTVITAAHCLESSHNVTVVLHTSSNATYRVNTNKFKIHPKWQPRLLRHDIALVELPRPPDRLDLYPIELQFNVKMTPKQQATVYGWKKSQPQPTWSKYQATIISNKDCAKYYGVLITKYTVCSQSAGQGSGCHGFSGGGLVVGGILVGVVSFGAKNCDMGYPIVYTKISRYREWIEKNSDNY